MIKLVFFNSICSVFLKPNIFPTKLGIIFTRGQCGKPSHAQWLISIDIEVTVNISDTVEA